MSTAKLLFSTASSEELCEYFQRCFEVGRFRPVFANAVRVSHNWTLRGRVIEPFHTVFVLDGRGRYRVGEIEFGLSKGMLLVVGGGIPHWTWPDPEACPYIFTAQFDCRTPNGDLAPVPSPQPFFVLRTDRVAYFERLYRELYAAWYGEERNREMISESCMQRILCEAIDTLLPSPITDPLIEQIAHYMKEPPYWRDSIDTLAKRTGLSRRAFTYRFRKVTGYSPGQYMIRQRCLAARGLLLETHLTIKEIARRLGYRDLYGFSRQFSRHMGISASEYRRIGRVP